MASTKLGKPTRKRLKERVKVRSDSLSDAMAMLMKEYKDSPEDFPGGRAQAKAIAYSKAEQKKKRSSRA